MTPIDTILDEAGRPLLRNEDKLACWRRHFEEVLNVDNAVGEDVLAKVMDNAGAETPKVTREEVERAVVKPRNSKAAGNDNIVAELLTS